MSTTFGNFEAEIVGGKLRKLSFTEKKPTSTADPLTETVKKQLCEYFEGERKSFNIAFEEDGTDFQKAVWKATRSIPHGKTASYKQIAEMIGRPKAFRACGNALNKNPLMILTPCHRVIASNGIGGFGGGLKMKLRLLALERPETFSNPLQNA